MTPIHVLIAAWLVLSPLVQVNLFQVRNSGIYLGVALTVLVVLVAAVKVALRPDRLPARSKLSVPLVALGLTAVVAGVQGALFYDRSVAGQHRYLAVQIYAVALVGLPIATAFAVPVLLQSLGDLRWLRRVIVAASVLLVIRGAIGEALPQIPWPSVPWWPMAATQGTALIAAWVLFESRRQWGWMALAAGFVAVFLAAVVIVPFYGNVPSQWLSGWITASVPIALLVFARFPRQVLRVSGPLLVLVLYWEYPQIERVIVLSRREGDFGRLLLWQDALGMAAQRPLFGIGPGNYLDYIMRYGQLGAMLSSPHGNYEQIAAEMGLVGLGFSLWLFGRALALGVRLYRVASNVLARSLAIAATCGLAGQLCAAFFGDFVVPNYHNGGYRSLSATIFAWVMMGLLIGLERIEGESASPPRAAAQTQTGDQRDDRSSDPLEGDRQNR